MAHTSTFDVPFRRRQEQKTDYSKRLALVKSGLPRLVVRKSNKFVYTQLIEFNTKGDKVLVSATSSELKDFGWNASKKNIPSAYLTGLLLGEKAKKAKVEKAVLDIGFRTPVHGSIPFAVLKGAIDSGLKINFDQSALPSDERISGKHIEDYASKLSTEEYNKKFSECSKNKVDVKTLTKLFDSTKKKILTGKY